MRCDSHVHIVGHATQYPQVPQRTYLCDVAELSALQRNAAPRDIRRFVVVQPSFYGTDNRATLEAVAALGNDARAVAVVDPAAISAAQLDDLHGRGVRGVRINLYSGLGAAAGLVETFRRHSELAKPKGWHVEVIANLGTILDSAEPIAQSGAAVVIDHYGLYGRTRPDSPEGRRFLELLALPHVWMKLSAPYRVSDNPVETHPDADWLKAILGVARDRCVWGSDWPWTPTHDQHRGPDVVLAFRPLSYAGMVDHFLAALPSVADQEAIMTHNPARLYGF